MHNMADIEFAAPCGLYCGDCEHIGVQCKGCGHQYGKPFWTVQTNIEMCPVYKCCRIRNRLEHCGLCDNFPCDMFNKFHDPALGPEEANQAVLNRIKDLLRRKELRTIEWLKMKSGQ
jgi:hypothetical protein